MSYSEADTRANFIDVQLKESWWENSMIKREYYFTDGRKWLNNKRWKRKFADYLLKYKWVNLAIIEAKKQDLWVTEWLEQVKDYWKILKLRFVYSSNWKEIYEFDLQTWKGQTIEKYPTPEELYNKVFEKINENVEKQPEIAVS